MPSLRVVGTRPSEICVLEDEEDVDVGVGEDEGVLEPPEVEELAAGQLAMEALLIR